MKAMVLTGIKKMELVNVPDPVLVNPDDVKIKMSVAGICGSDIHYYTWGNIGSQVVKYPFTVGHEGSGIIAETGPGVKHLKAGDKVATILPCPVSNAINAFQADRIPAVISSSSVVPDKLQSAVGVHCNA